MIVRCFIVSEMYLFYFLNSFVVKEVIEGDFFWFFIKVKICFCLLFFERFIVDWYLCFKRLMFYIINGRVICCIFKNKINYEYKCINIFKLIK